MWITSLESPRRTASLMGATIDVLVEPDRKGPADLGVVRVTVPPASTLPAHDHGESDAVLVALAGELLLFGPGGRVVRLEPGTLAVVPAHERVSAQNPTTEPASMLVCFAPPTFVEAIGAAAPEPLAVAAAR